MIPKIRRRTTAARIIVTPVLAGLAIAVTALGLLGPEALRAQAASASGKVAIVQMDSTTLQQFLHSAGYRTRGAGKISQAESSNPNLRTFPHFASAFTVHGVTYPFTMLGYPPKSGRKALFRSVIVPLRLHFLGFGPKGNVNVDFDPGIAVANMVNSPMYQNAHFINGYGQFGEMMQRAAFWNMMDKERQWSVSMAPPRIAPTIDVQVFPDMADPQFPLIQVGNDLVGNVLIDYIDGLAQTLIEAEAFAVDEVPIFVTGNAIAQALGYHSAARLSNPAGNVSLYTYIYTSWLDPALVPAIYADVSTFDHENLEWMNDPFINNVVPTWMYPPDNDPRTVCSGNNLLEVGDPQGNGPTFDDYPAITVPIDGIDYHLQQLVLFEWFTDKMPSPAQNGWYTYPDPSSLKEPAVYCK